MKATPLAAFGHVMYLCTAPAGSSLKTPLGADGRYASGLYYFVKGVANLTVLETQEALAPRMAGWLNVDNQNAGAAQTGMLQCDYPEETQWLCVPHLKNPLGLPMVSRVEQPAEATWMIPNGTNLLLVGGSLSIKGRTFTGPAQIRVRSGDVEATALEAVYALEVLKP